ncbi:hypothetical protein ASPACDRAFT_42634 [Aspergillus aculeatus ATCC 16872]|uniref:Uncharacterized protein n=1 Tax=Aspergillus aculeatus (strain ATCC 16872 / CBS 172.66 / WB 5094) TaxID=690307 RepID=A0A1L9WYB0_ASPA1|nr:uncharacterized protein ASPACDRAFT_42634 [Aspergillus aculeatus ATCC 16872]OJK01133.1 hypothetical protein ASPACDRAFT_42634 [Aspergillus aculeatus ATCC 16872]
MEPETSPSRDPRLVRSFRPTATRTLSETHSRLSAQHLSTHSVTEPNTSNPDHLIRGVSDLVQAAILAANSKSERDRLQKRKEATATLCTKAKSFNNFPSTAAFFQKSQADEDTELTRVEEALKRHNATYQQRENALRLTLGSSIFDTSRSEQTNHLQREVQTARSDLGSARAEITKLRDYNVTLEHKLKELQDRVTRTEKASSDYASTLQRHAKHNTETIERIVHLRSALNKRSESLPPKDQIDKLLSSISDVGGRLESLETKNKQDIEEYRDLLDNLRRDYDDKFARFLADQMTRYHSHLDSMENRLAQGSVLSEKTQLQQIKDTKYHSLTERMDKLQELQAMKDDLAMSEMEELKNHLKTHLEQSKVDISKIKSENSQLCDELKIFFNKDKSNSNGRITALETALHTAEQNFESVKIGLHSLEMRYNNLSTGPLVRSMAQAMQEMYPGAAQMIDRMKLLTKQFEQRLPQLDAKIENLEKDLGSRSNSTLQKQNHLAQQVETLVKQHEALSQSLAPLRSPSTGEISNTNVPSGRLRAVQDEVKELASAISSYVESRKTEVESLVQKMEEERDSLRSQSQVLTEELASLSAQVTKVHETMRADIKRLKSYPAEIQTHQYEIRQLQQATSTKWEDLAAKVKKLEESANRFLPIREGSETSSQPLHPAVTNSVQGSGSLLGSVRDRKRPRVSAVSDGERGSQSRASSPYSFSSQVGLDSTPNSESKKVLKKAKKKRRRQTEEAIIVD